MNDNWTNWHGEFRDLVRACLGPDGDDDSTRIARVLQPCHRHYHLLKPRQSALLASALPVLLEQKHIDSIVLTGVATDACILATALDARMRGLQCWVPEDATAAISIERRDRALQLLLDNECARCTPSTEVNGLFPD